MTQSGEMIKMVEGPTFFLYFCFKEIVLLLDNTQHKSFFNITYDIPQTKLPHIIYLWQIMYFLPKEMKVHLLQRKTFFNNKSCTSWLMGVCWRKIIILLQIRILRHVNLWICSESKFNLCFEDRTIDSFQNKGIVLPW